MTRASAGNVTRRRHKKILKMTSGYQGSRHRLYRRANEAMLKSLSHAYRHRRTRKRDFRRLWITRINAAARKHGMSYGRFMHGLKQSGVGLDRKILANMAVHDEDGFAQLVDLAKEAVVASPAI